MISDVVKPVAAALGKELAGVIAPVAAEKLRAYARQYNINIPEPQIQAAAEDVSRAKNAREAAWLLEQRLRAYAPGGVVGTAPIESPPRPHDAGAPASVPVAVADAALSEHDEDEHDIDRDQRMAWRRSQAAAAPLAPYVSPFGLGMAGTVPGEPDTWTKVKYVSYGVLGTGVVVCVVYTFVKALGWIIERLYYPPRRRAWSAAHS